MDMFKLARYSNLISISNKDRTLMKIIKGRLGKRYKCQMPTNMLRQAEAMSLACNFKRKTQMRDHAIAFMDSIYTLSFE